MNAGGNTEDAAPVMRPRRKEHMKKSLTQKEQYNDRS